MMSVLMCLHRVTSCMHFYSVYVLYLLHSLCVHEHHQRAVIALRLVKRREELPPLAWEDLGVLLALVPSVLLTCPELHEEHCSSKVDHSYLIRYFYKQRVEGSLLPISKPVMMTIPRTPRVSYQ
jgi:hypothetical protein